MEIPSILPRVSEEVLQIGMEYGRTECGIEPNEVILRQLYYKMSGRRKYLQTVAENAKGKRKSFFLSARKWALDSMLTERNKEERDTYIAYSRILAKMANAVLQFRRQQQIKNPNTRPPRSPRAQEYTALGADDRQYEFILPAK
jgi:hypothetical protein